MMTFGSVEKTELDCKWRIEREQDAGAVYSCTFVPVILFCRPFQDAEARQKLDLTVG